MALLKYYRSYRKCTLKGSEARVKNHSSENLAQIVVDIFSK